VVRGTEFVVQVSQGSLERVFVEEGIVEVVMPGEDAIRLEAGGVYPPRAPSDDAPTEAESPFGAPWWRETGPSASMGWLEVQSDPPAASVRVGDQQVGRTPLRVRWPTGDFRVVITRPGFPRWRRRVQVRAEQTTEVQAQLSDERKPSRADLWTAAEADLDARRCRKLQSRVESSLLGGSDESRARATMLVAECALRTGARKRALTTYQSILGRYPQTESAEVAWFESAKLLARLGRSDAALTSFGGYLERYPDGQFAAAATFRRCDLLIRTERLDSARSCLRDYRRDFPAGVHTNDVTLLLATLARVDGQWTRAAELYRQYLAAGPSATRREEALYQLVVCLEKGNLAGVEDAAREYLRSYPRGKHREALENIVR
jgi:TolA-binding protein